MDVHVRAHFRPCWNDRSHDIAAFARISQNRSTIGESHRTHQSFIIAHPINEPTKPTLASMVSGSNTPISMFLSHIHFADPQRGQARGNTLSESSFLSTMLLGSQCRGRRLPTRPPATTILPPYHV